MSMVLGTEGDTAETVDNFLKHHPELAEHRAALIELAIAVVHLVGCSWPGCQDQ